MVGLFIVSVLIGAVAALLIGSGTAFWVAVGIFFICGLPFALVTSFVYDAVSYAADRADERQVMAELAEDERRALEHERGGTVYNDNRQVHIRQEILHTNG